MLDHRWPLTFMVKIAPLHPRSQDLISGSFTFWGRMIIELVAWPVSDWDYCLMLAFTVHDVMYIYSTDQLKPNTEFTDFFHFRFLSFHWTWNERFEQYEKHEIWLRISLIWTTWKLEKHEIWLRISLIWTTWKTWNEIWLRISLIWTWKAWNTRVHVLHDGEFNLI